MLNDRVVLLTSPEAVEAFLGRSGHDHMAILAPVEMEHAAIKLYVRRAIHQSSALRGDDGRAGGRAASHGDARAALPDPEPDRRWAGDLGEADIGALRKLLVVLECRANLGDVEALDILHEEHCMRIADIDADRAADLPALTD